MVHSYARAKGFTLIEVVVVVVIVGVLAIILVPTLISYISKSKLSTANTNAKLSFEAAAEYCVFSSNNDAPVSVGNYNEICLKSKKIPDEVTYDGKHLEDALLKSMGSKSSKAGYASISVNIRGVPQDARWSAKPGDKYVGSYPKRAGEVSAYDLSY
ncbi:MAG: prepilin-type N-terminal cleavage/methylation domain-containing protein [Oscillospiraceae bacterium]|nr:prepilin-type N-terminal cleavage/methylation domain-containing protein [Oscillospiraceae bacterium]